MKRFEDTSYRVFAIVEDFNFGNPEKQGENTHSVTRIRFGAGSPYEDDVDVYSSTSGLADDMVPGGDGVGFGPWVHGKDREEMKHRLDEMRAKEELSPGVAAQRYLKEFTLLHPPEKMELLVAPEVTAYEVDGELYLGEDAAAEAAAAVDTETSLDLDPWLLNGGEVNSRALLPGERNDLEADVTQRIEKLWEDLAPR